MARHKELLTELLSFSLYLIAVVCAFWWLGSRHSLIADWIGLPDQVELTMDAISSVLGIAAAAMAVIISSRQEANKQQQAARDQIYQQLELESINLFRFEIDNVELARIVWEDTLPYEEVKDDDKHPGKYYQVLQHLCQILNLFEMAVRFKRDGIVHDDVFNSWEAWIFDLCRSEIFLRYWYLEGVQDNYIQLFRKIVDEGLRCCHGEEKVAAIIKQQDKVADPCFDNFRRVLRQHLAA